MVFLSAVRRRKASPAPVVDVFSFPGYRSPISDPDRKLTPADPKTSRRGRLCAALRGSQARPQSRSIHGRHSPPWSTGNGFRLTIRSATVRGANEPVAPKAKVQTQRGGDGNAQIPVIQIDWLTPRILHRWEFAKIKTFEQSMIVSHQGGAGERCHLGRCRKHERRSRCMARRSRSTAREERPPERRFVLRD
jgi:hypothetical protein